MKSANSSSANASSKSVRDKIDLASEVVARGVAAGHAQRGF